jgi:hypothetical protein
MLPSIVYHPSCFVHSYIGKESHFQDESTCEVNSTIDSDRIMTRMMARIGVVGSKWSRTKMRLDIPHIPESGFHMCRGRIPQICEGSNPGHIKQIWPLALY